jgi:endoglycosylceramidase
LWSFWRDDDGFGLLNADDTDEEIFMQYLNRPYPQAVMGNIKAFAFDAESALFTLIFVNNGTAPPDAIIFVPSVRQYPNDFVVFSTDPDDTWTQAHDPDTQVLRTAADPDSPTHTITIRPSADQSAG